MKWYAVPGYTFQEDNTLPASKRPAQVVDAYGQMVAEVSFLDDAEEIARLHNERSATGASHLASVSS